MLIIDIKKLDIAETKLKELAKLAISFLMEYLLNFIKGYFLSKIGITGLKLSSEIILTSLNLNVFNIFS